MDALPMSPGSPDPHSSPARPSLLRLKSRPQFQAAMSGQTLARTPHFVLHCAPLPARPTGEVRVAPLFEPEGVWIGAVVPKRWARRAVTRNTIKRQIYTVSQHYAARLSLAAHVVRLRNGFDRAQFVSAKSDRLKAVVRSELMHLFESACTLTPAPVRIPRHAA